jgi:hypothetical protein
MNLTLLLLYAIGWICAALVGMLFCRAFVPPEDRRDPFLYLIGFAMTVGAVGTMMLPLGLFVEYSPRMYTLVLRFWILISVFVWYAAGRKPAGPRNAGPASVTLISLLPWVVPAAMALLSFSAAIGPPTSNEWDSLAYHLAVPKVWLANGLIGPVSYDHHSNFPMLLELHYAFHGAAAVKALHWMSGITTALLIAWAANRWVSRRSSPLAAALFLTVPIVAWESTTAYVDLTSTLFVTLAVYAVLRWKENPAATGWLWLSAIMAGFACGTKMTMLAVAGLLVLWLTWLRIRNHAPVNAKRLLAYATIAAVVGGGWYVKTWAFTGNPVYPFAYERLGGKWWSAQAAKDYSAEQARFGIGKTPLGFLAAPWTTAFQSHYYANPPSVFKGDLSAPPESGFPTVYGNLGIAVIGLLPLWHLARRRHPAVVSMIWFSGSFFLVWFALTHQTRYLLPVLPLLIIASTAGAVEFWRKGNAWRWAVGSFAALSVLFGLLPSREYAKGMAVGPEGVDYYLTKREPMYGISEYANKNLVRGARVLLLQETRGYWLDVPYMWGNPSQNALIPWETFQSTDETLAKLGSMGITHVVINWSATTEDSSREHWPKLMAEAVMRGRLRALYSTREDPFRGIKLYALEESGKVRPDLSR